MFTHWNTSMTIFDNMFLRKLDKDDLSKPLQLLTVAFTRSKASRKLIDMGWLLYQVKWEEGNTWDNTIRRYVVFVSDWSVTYLPEYIPTNAPAIVFGLESTNVVADGYAFSLLGP